MILELLTGEQRERIVEDSTNRETLISLALEGNQSIVVPMLVDRLYPSVQARAARKLWRDIGATFEEDSPVSIKDPTTQVFELEWDGKVHEAIDLAKQNKNPLLVDFVRQRHFLWNELSRENAKLPKPADVRHVDQLHDATLQALYARWSQRIDMAEEWRNMLAQVPSKSIDPYELGSALVAIGEFKEGLRLLETVSPMNAFHCYQYLGDVDAMFRLGGIEDVSKLDANQWLESRSASLKTGLGISTQEFAITAELSSLLHRLGRVEDSKVIDDALMRFAEINSTISNMEILKAWVDNGRRDRAIKRSLIFSISTHPPEISSERKRVISNRCWRSFSMNSVF